MPKTCFIFMMCCCSYFISAQEFTLDFSDATVDCSSTQVCYDVTLASNGLGFGLGSYNLRLFYDASRLSYVVNSPNIASLPGPYSLGMIQDQSANLTGFGSLAFESTLGFLEIGVDYTPSTPVTVAGTPINVLENLCFTLLDPAILSDPANCFDLIWVTDSSRDGYTNAVTTLNNANSGLSADLANSTYIDLTTATNCLVDACVVVVDPCDPIVDADGDGVCDVGPDADPDPQDPCIPDASSGPCVASMVTFELDFTTGILDCEDQTLCYDVTIEAPVGFDLGSYNLRIFYDADLLDLIDASPNLNPGSALDGSYTINSINDTPGGNQSLNGSLPFDDNLSLLDVSVDYSNGTTPIGVNQINQTILYDLCFDVLDPAVFEDGNICIHAVWVTNATEENYTVGETTVNVAGNTGISTNLNGSIYNDLEPSGANCFINACLDGCPAIACNDNVQISLDNMCAGVTLDMLLEGSFDHAVKIFVTGEDGKTISGTSMGLDDEFYLNDTTLFNWSPYVGELVKYTVVSECDGNSCWGETKIEINQLPSLESPCKVTPGAIVEKVITYEEVIDGPVTFTYPINDPTCQIPATVTHSGDLLYACSLGDDGIIGTSDDGWCTASCNVIDDLAGNITVVFDPSLGDPTGVAIPASAVCKIKVEVPDCTSCTAWCSEEGTRSYPDGFVTLDDIYEMIESGCFANIEGDIIKVEDVKGDACESLTTVLYYANVNIHGNIEKVLLLEQAFKTVKLDPNHLYAPNGPVILDCGSVSNAATPDEIFAETGSGSQAFPWFEDKHTLIPRTVKICGLDHYEVVIDTMEQLVAVDVDTDKDGIDDSKVWVLLPVVQKELRDSTYCEVVTIATDGGIIVEDKDGKCLGDGTDFILSAGKDNPVVITSPTVYAGNGAIAPGSNTCEEATVPAIVHIESGKYCNLIVSYSDQGPFEACGSGFKIIRTWQALDWCDGTVGGIHLGSQFIEVIDTEAPVIPALVDDAVSIDPWTCFAKYPLNIPTADDGCEGTTISYDIDVSAGRYDPESGFIVDLYPQDSISIIVEVADDCFNIALDTFTLTVFDGVAPVPVCHENLTITLTTGGVAKVYAEDFDAGSHDAGCGDVKVYAARMTGCCDEECAGGEEVCLEYDKFGECLDYGNSPETDEFGEFVKFCCQDAGQKVMVAILVVDAAGNKNTCMVEATVVDKSAVTLACEDMTINCQDDMDDVSRASAIAAVCEGGSPDLYSETFNETGCGTGTVIREWWIDKDADGVLSSGDAYCEQTITILPGEEQAFDPYTIKWPVHYTGEVYEGINLECNDEGELRTFDGERVPMGDVFACSSADLDIAPVWCSSPCGLVGYSVEEETVVASDACLKVIKRWTVIDWCKWDPNGTTPVDDANDSSNDSFIAVADWTTPDCYGCEDNQADPYYFKYDRVDRDGYYTFDQVIKVVDDSDPSIEVVDSFVQSADGGAVSKNDDTKCVGEGTITAIARDQCGGEDSGAEFLSWVIERYENGELAATKNAEGETVDMSTGAGGPGDVHKIVWRASDGCGNSTKSETEVTFDDNKAPTPLCVSGVTTAFMESTGTVAIWANDFDLGSFDNCTDLDFTMVPSGVDPAQPGSEEFDSQKSYTLFCDDVTSFIEFNVWVWDANGLGDFCTVGVLVGGECMPGEEGASGLLLAGNIQTEFGEMIEGVNTVISSAALSEFPKSMSTGVNGQYVFANNPAGYDFKINAHKNDDAINGVSTLDLVLIQKHILGVTPFDSAYKVIASDANNDETVTASDLLALRKLILGIDLGFTNNESWRFVAANSPILSQENPWPFTETINISNLIASQMTENFIGIKIGDVNGNAVANGLSKSETRSAGLISLETNNVDLVNGQIVRVPVSSTSFNEVFGFQFTAELNGLTYRDIESGAIEVSEQNLGLFNQMMTMSWEKAEAVSSTETLFTLVFEATSDIQLSKALAINSAKINSEMYVGNALDVFAVDMAFNNSNVITDMSLNQNDPNPFSAETRISFVLPQKADATIQITNVSGEVIRTISGQYTKGLNSIVLSRQELNLTTGLYYYTLESNQVSLTKKMIVINE